MKNILLVMLLQGVLFNNLLAEIKNGYEKNLPHFRESLLKLKQALLNNAKLTSQETRRIKREIQSLLTSIACYHVTDSLLKQFRAISPEQYEELNTLRDFNNRNVDVYVRFVTTGDLERGFALIGQTPHDPHQCFSEYGEGTVSVKIRIGYHTLRTLAHEFGHIRYVVPNLRSYIGFYQRKYNNVAMDAELGHDLNDLGGRLAISYERQFCGRHARYIRERSGPRIVPDVAYRSIRRSIDDQTNHAVVAEPAYTGNFLLYFPFREKQFGQF